MQTAANSYQSFSSHGREPPRISPLVRELTNQRRDLSFSIDTGGRPFYRVLLTTDPALFHPSRAGQRGESNFYDGLQHELQPYDGRYTHYLVPRAVLRALHPARSIWYTVIAYDDHSGQGAAYALAPERLDTEAPAISIAADYRPDALGLLWGTPVERLTRIGAAPAPAAAAAAAAYEEVGEDFALDAEEEWAEGEALGFDDDADHGHWPAAGLEAAPFGEEDHDDEPPYAAGAAEASGYSAYGYGDGDHDDGYRDGYEDAAGFAAEDEPGEDVGAGAMDYGMAYGDEGDGADGAHPDLDLGSAYAADDDTARPAYFRDPDAGAFGLEAAGPGAFGFGLEAGGSGAPGMLYDEEADGAAHNAASYGDDDGVEIADEPGAKAQGFGLGDAGAAAYGEDDFDLDDGRYAEAHAAAPVRPAQPFDIEARKAILARVAPFESGTQGYQRVVADGEFNGEFGTGHPAYRRFHLGVTFGAFPFVQENGTLFKFMEKLRDERYAAAFEEAFEGKGPAILALLEAGGPHSSTAADGLSPRLQRLEGKFLWEEPWLSRFRKAAALRPLQGVQNLVASELWIEPLLRLAKGFGLTSARALTLVVDRAVQMGVVAAKRWIAEAVNPIKTPAQIQQALAALGHADIAACQRAAGLPVSGEWDPDTQAAAVGALAASGRSPVPLLHAVQAIEALQRRADGTPWAERLQRLAREIPPDVEYQL